MKNLSDEELFRFLDDDCPPDIKKEFQDVINRNPEVRARLDQIGATEESANHLGLETVSSNFTELVLHKLRAQSRSRRAFDTKPLRFALILLGLVVAAFIIGVETSGQPVQSPYLPQMQVLEPLIDTIVTIGSSEFFKVIAVIIMGFLTLFLFDIFVLKPFFSSHQNKLAA